MSGFYARLVVGVPLSAVYREHGPLKFVFGESVPEQYEDWDLLEILSRLLPMELDVWRAADDVAEANYIVGVSLGEHRDMDSLPTAVSAEQLAVALENVREDLQAYAVDCEPQLYVMMCVDF